MTFDFEKKTSVCLKLADLTYPTAGVPSLERNLNNCFLKKGAIVRPFFRQSV